MLPTLINTLIPNDFRITNGTIAEGLIAALRALNIPVSDPIRGVPISEWMPKCIDERREAIFLHQCNGIAQPVPKGSTDVAHWRVTFGIDSQNIATMNPWGGINESVSAAAMESADLMDHFEILGVMSKDLPPPQLQQLPPFPFF